MIGCRIKINLFLFCIFIMSLGRTERPMSICWSNDFFGQNTQFKRCLFQLLTCAALLGRPILTATQRLQSKLPVQPIEDPDLWAWGEHPNGVGYKAANDLLFETCLATPDSPLCYNAATKLQCVQNLAPRYVVQRKSFTNT